MAKRFCSFSAKEDGMKQKDLHNYITVVIAIRI